MELMLQVFLFAFLTSAVMCGTCPNYWTTYNGHCYRLYQAQVNWQTAKSRCEQNSAYLVSINSLGENDFVSYLTACSSDSNRGPRTWIGLGPNYHQQSPKRWLDGNAMTYHRWVSGEPNNGGNNEGCIETNKRNRGEWNDKECSSASVYMCEKADS